MNRVIVKELKSIKLNVNNIHSSLINFNKRQVNLTSSITRFEDRAEKRKKLQSKEDKLESPLVSSLDNIKNTVKPSGDEGGGNIFDKLFEFIGLILAGIIVNALPAIIKKCKEIVDGVTSFFAPIQSTFSLILAFLSGEIDKSDYDADKKRVNDGFDKLNRRGGLVDKMLDKTGPLKPLIKRLLSALNMGKSGKNVVLAKKGGKEGFYNKQTKKFTERQWTSAERKEYETTKDSSKQKEQETQHPDDPGANPDRGHGAGTPGARRVASYEPGKGNRHRKIFLHWTAGAYTTPYSAYHTVFLGDGTPVRYTPYGKDKNSHTAEANTGSIGLSIAAMGGEGVGENYFGTYPPTAKQLEALVTEAARVAVDWGWTASTIDSNVRTHGEWERYAVPAGILPPPVQRWDLDKLKQSDPNINTRKVLSAGGNELRRRIKAKFNELKSAISDKNGKGGGRPLSLSIGPTGKDRLHTINQPMYEDMDDEEEMVNISIQPVNTIKTSYIYSPIPRRVRQVSTSSQSKLPPIWSM